MDMTISRYGVTLVAGPSGRIEGGETAESLHQAIGDALLPQDRALILDLDNVTYVSSAGLRTIARIAQRTRKSGTALIVCAPKAHIRELFTVSGFDQMITVVNNLDDAKSIMAGA